MQTAQSKQARARRKRADTTLIFDPARKVPGAVLDAILQEMAPAHTGRAVPSRARYHA